MYCVDYPQLKSVFVLKRQLQSYGSGLDESQIALKLVSRLEKEEKLPPPTVPYSVDNGLNNS